MSNTSIQIKTYSTIKEVQDDLLVLLKEFDRVCKKNNIKYTLDGGTLLGAYRHHGFIPWDDDADIAMLRKEYNKFLKAAKKDLDSNRFVLERPGHPKTYSYNFAKLKMLNSFFSEEETKGVKENHGLWLDIFPIDKTFHQFTKFQTKMAYFYQSIRWQKNGRIFNTKHRKLVSFLSKILPYWFINLCIDFHLRIFNIFPAKNVSKLCHYGKNKEPHTVKFYLNLSSHIFCDTYLSVMAESEKWLKLRYGDWQKMPPKNEQHPEHGLRNV